MSYLYTGSSQSAATNTGLSTSILLVCDGQPVGAIQSLVVSETRSLRRIPELGTDGFIEIVPQSGAEVELRVTRIYFDRKSITAAFNRGFVSIHSQRIPFDIYQYNFQDVAVSGVSGQFDPANEYDVSNLSAANPGLITTIYENCWFTSISSNYTATDYVISQDASIWAEFVHTHANGDPNQPASLGQPQFVDNVEKKADIGRRGSLDARGLSTLGNLFSSLNNV